MVLLFWYRLTWVFPEKGPLNGCVCDSRNRLPSFHSCMFDRVVHLVIMLEDGESLLLMNLVNHSMEMYSAQLYKKLRFVTVADYIAL